MNNCLLIIFVLLLTSCQKKMNMKGRVLYYGDSPYSGEYISYSGAIKKIENYKNGLKEGDAVFYYLSGQIKKTGSYKLGFPNGEHFSYYESGKKAGHAQFKDGKHHGDYILWHENGQVAEYVLYEKGEVLGYKKWRPNGKIYANYQNTEAGRYGLVGSKLCFETKDEL